MRPSGRSLGPENSTSIARDSRADAAGLGWAPVDWREMRANSLASVLRGAAGGESEAAVMCVGSDTGCSASPSAGSGGGSAACRLSGGCHGMIVSTWYASDVVTTLPSSGTHTQYAPGVSMDLPRLMPVQARTAQVMAGFGTTLTRAHSVHSAAEGQNA